MRLSSARRSRRRSESARRGSPASKELPKGGLVHLHFDLVVNGRFTDPEPWLKTWPHLEQPRITLQLGQALNA